MVKENLIFNNLILLGAGKSSRFNKGDDTFVANKNSISEDSVNKGSINQDTVSKVKKQFFLLDGIPLFLHSLVTFINSGYFKKIILVIDLAEKQKYLTFINQYKKLFYQEIDITFVQGGEHRYLSVWQGLQYVDENLPFVFVHDCARPYLTERAIIKIVQNLDEKKSDGLVPVEPLVNSVKEVENNYIVKTLPREKTKTVTTPQVFPTKNFLQVYSQFMEQKNKNIPTDDSEIYGEKFKVKTIQLPCKNDKVTFRSDFKN